MKIMGCAKFEKLIAKSKIKNTDDKRCYEKCVFASICTLGYIPRTRDDKSGDSMSRLCLRANESCKYKSDF